MLRRIVRRLNPLWAYREEMARKSHPGSREDQEWGWVFAPTSAALYSVAWQLALVSGVLGLAVLLTHPGAGSVWRELLMGSVAAAFALLFAGGLAQTGLVIEAVRRRRWGMILGGVPGAVVVLRAVDYAFGPRRPFHPQPRFVPGKLSLGADVDRS